MLSKCKLPVWALGVGCIGIVITLFTGCSSEHKELALGIFVDGYSDKATATADFDTYEPTLTGIDNAFIAINGIQLQNSSSGNYYNDLERIDPGTSVRLSFSYNDIAFEKELSMPGGSQSMLE